MTLSKSTIAELNRIQNMVVRFILQLPKSASMVAGFVDGGMKPMDLRVMERTCLFVWKSLRSLDKLLKAVFNAHRNDADDGWNKLVSDYIGLIGAQYCAGRKAQLKCGKCIGIEEGAFILICYVPANKVVQVTCLHEGFSDSGGPE